MCFSKNNNFWKDVFNSMLCVIKSFDDNHVEENFSSMPVWYNSHIRVGMKTLFIKVGTKKV